MHKASRVVPLVFFFLNDISLSLPLSPWIFFQLEATLLLSSTHHNHFDEAQMQWWIYVNEKFMYETFTKT